MKRSLNLFLIILVASFLIQLTIILYNDYTGYHTHESFLQFAVALIVGTLFSGVIATALLFLDLKILKRFDDRLPWVHHRLRRGVLETLAAVAGGVMMGAVATTLSWVLFGYDEPLTGVYVVNAIIAAAINLLIITIAEAVLFYRRHQREQIRAEDLERENLAMRFETLKKQLDPHFLFNSLNVLSSLVRKDRDKAQDFIDEFSHVYRYTLEVIDKPVVPLGEELDFARSYLFLQKIRFDKAIRVEFDVDEADHDALVPPLAIQTLLENAFKHNVATHEHPLQLRIFTKDHSLYVVNTLRPKPVPAEGSRMGFENLKNRYRLVSGTLPEVILTRNEYQVKLEFVQSTGS